MYATLRARRSHSATRVVVTGMAACFVLLSLNGGSAILGVLGGLLGLMVGVVGAVLGTAMWMLRRNRFR